MHPTDRPLLQPDKARRERDELLAKIDEAVPHMYDTRRTALGGASPASRQIGTGRPGGGAPAHAPAPRQDPPASRVSKAPPGFDTGAGAGTTKRKRSLFGR